MTSRLPRTTFEHTPRSLPASFSALVHPTGWTGAWGAALRSPLQSAAAATPLLVDVTAEAVGSVWTADCATATGGLELANIGANKIIRIVGCTMNPAVGADNVAVRTIGDIGPTSVIEIVDCDFNIVRTALPGHNIAYRFAAIWLTNGQLRDDSRITIKETTIHAGVDGFRFFGNVMLFDADFSVGNDAVVEVVDSTFTTNLERIGRGLWFRNNNIGDRFRVSIRKVTANITINYECCSEFISLESGTWGDSAIIEILDSNLHTQAINYRAVSFFTNAVTFGASPNLTIVNTTLSSKSEMESVCVYMYPGTYTGFDVTLDNVDCTFRSTLVHANPDRRVGGLAAFATATVTDGSWTVTNSRFTAADGVDTALGAAMIFLPTPLNSAWKGAISNTVFTAPPGETVPGITVPGAVSTLPTICVFNATWDHGTYVFPPSQFPQAQRTSGCGAVVTIDVGDAVAAAGSSSITIPCGQITHGVVFDNFAAGAHVLIEGCVITPPDADPRGIFIGDVGVGASLRVIDTTVIHSRTSDTNVFACVYVDGALSTDASLTLGHNFVCKITFSGVGQKGRGLYLTGGHTYGDNVRVELNNVTVDIALQTNARAVQIDTNTYGDNFQLVAHNSTTLKVKASACCADVFLLVGGTFGENMFLDFSSVAMTAEASTYGTLGVFLEPAPTTAGTNGRLRVSDSTFSLSTGRTGSCLFFRQSHFVNFNILVEGLKCSIAPTVAPIDGNLDGFMVFSQANLSTWSGGSVTISSSSLTTAGAPGFTRHVLAWPVTVSGAAVFTLQQFTLSSGDPGNDAVFVFPAGFIVNGTGGLCMRQASWAHDGAAFDHPPMLPVSTACLTASATLTRESVTINVGANAVSGVWVADCDEISHGVVLQNIGDGITAIIQHCVVAPPPLDMYHGIRVTGDIGVDAVLKIVNTTVTRTRITGETRDGALMMDRNALKARARLQIGPGTTLHGINVNALALDELNPATSAVVDITNSTVSSIGRYGIWARQLTPSQHFRWHMRNCSSFTATNSIAVLVNLGIWGTNGTINVQDSRFTGVGSGNAGLRFMNNNFNNGLALNIQRSYFSNTGASSKSHALNFEKGSIRNVHVDIDDSVFEFEARASSAAIGFTAGSNAVVRDGSLTVTNSRLITTAGTGGTSLAAIRLCRTIENAYRVVISNVTATDTTSVGMHALLVDSGGSVHTTSTVCVHRSEWTNGTAFNWPPELTAADYCLSKTATPSDTAVASHSTTDTVRSTATASDSQTMTTTESMAVTGSRTAAASGTVTLQLTPSTTASVVGSTSRTLTATWSLGRTASVTAALTRSVTRSISATGTMTLHQTASSTATLMATKTESLATTGTVSLPFTSSGTVSRTATAATETLAVTGTLTLRHTLSSTPSSSPLVTASLSGPTSSATAAATATATASGHQTLTATVAATATRTKHATLTQTSSATATSSGHQTLTDTAPVTPTETIIVAIPTATATLSRLPTPTAPPTATLSPTATPGLTTTPLVTKTKEKTETVVPVIPPALITSTNTEVPAHYAALATAGSAAALTTSSFLLSVDRGAGGTAQQRPLMASLAFAMVEANRTSSAVVAVKALQVAVTAPVFDSISVNGATVATSLKPYDARTRPNDALSEASVATTPCGSIRYVSSTAALPSVTVAPRSSSAGRTATSDQMTVVPGPQHQQTCKRYVHLSAHIMTSAVAPPSGTAATSSLSVRQEISRVSIATVSGPGSTGAFTIGAAPSQAPQPFEASSVTWDNTTASATVALSRHSQACAGSATAPSVSLGANASVGSFQALVCDQRDMNVFTAEPGMVGVGAEQACVTPEGAACESLPDFHRACAAASDCAGITAGLVSKTGAAYGTGAALGATFFEQALSLHTVGSGAASATITDAALASLTAKAGLTPPEVVVQATFYRRIPESDRVCTFPVAPETASDMCPSSSASTPGTGTTGTARGGTVEVSVLQSNFAAGYVDVFQEQPPNAAGFALPKLRVARCGGTNLFAKSKVGTSGECGRYVACASVAVGAGDVITVRPSASLNQYGCAYSLSALAVFTPTAASATTPAPPVQAPFAGHKVSGFTQRQIAVRPSVFAQGTVGTVVLSVVTSPIVVNATLQVAQTRFGCTGPSASCPADGVVQISSVAASSASNTAQEPAVDTAFACGGALQFPQHNGLSDQCQASFDCARSLFVPSSARGAAWAQRTTIAVNIAAMAAVGASTTATDDVCASFTARLFVQPAAGSTMPLFPLLTSDAAFGSLRPLALVPTISVGPASTSADLVALALPAVLQPSVSTSVSSAVRSSMRGIALADITALGNAQSVAVFVDWEKLRAVQNSTDALIPSAASAGAAALNASSPAVVATDAELDLRVRAVLRPDASFACIMDTAVPGTAVTCAVPVPVDATAVKIDVLQTDFSASALTVSMTRPDGTSLEAPTVCGGAGGSLFSGATPGAGQCGRYLTCRSGLFDGFSGTLPPVHDRAALVTLSLPAMVSNQLCTYAFTAVVTFEQKALPARACVPATEFTCPSDGTCIPRTAVCDNTPDNCADGADEAPCTQYTLVENTVQPKVDSGIVSATIPVATYTECLREAVIAEADAFFLTTPGVGCSLVNATSATALIASPTTYLTVLAAGAAGTNELHVKTPLVSPRSKYTRCSTTFHCSQQGEIRDTATCACQCLTSYTGTHCDVLVESGVVSMYVVGISRDVAMDSSGRASAVPFNSIAAALVPATFAAHVTVTSVQQPMVYNATHIAFPFTADSPNRPALAAYFARIFTTDFLDEANVALLPVTGRNDTLSFLFGVDAPNSFLIMGGCSVPAVTAVGAELNTTCPTSAFAQGTLLFEGAGVATVSVAAAGTAAPTTQSRSMAQLATTADAVVVTCDTDATVKGQTTSVAQCPPTRCLVNVTSAALPLQTALAVTNVTADPSCPTPALSVSMSKFIDPPQTTKAEHVAISSNSNSSFIIAAIGTGIMGLLFLALVSVAVGLLFVSVKRAARAISQNSAAGMTAAREAWLLARESGKAICGRDAVLVSTATAVFLVAVCAGFFAVLYVASRDVSGNTAVAVEFYPTKLCDGAMLKTLPTRATTVEAVDKCRPLTVAGDSAGPLFGVALCVETATGQQPQLYLARQQSTCERNQGSLVTAADGECIEASLVLAGETGFLRARCVDLNAASQRMATVSSHNPVAAADASVTVLSNNDGQGITAASATSVQTESKAQVGYTTLRTTSTLDGTVASIAGPSEFVGDYDAARLVHQTENAFDDPRATLAISALETAAQPNMTSLNLDRTTALGQATPQGDYPIGFLFGAIGTPTEISADAAGTTAFRYRGVRKTAFDVGDAFVADRTKDGTAVTFKLWLRATTATRGFAFVVADDYEDPHTRRSPLITRLMRIAAAGEAGAVPWFNASWNVYASLYVDGSSRSMQFIAAGRAADVSATSPRDFTKVERARWDLTDMGSTHLFNGRWHRVSLALRNEQGRTSLSLAVDGKTGVASSAWRKCIGGPPHSIDASEASNASSVKVITVSRSAVARGGSLFVGYLNGGVQGVSAARKDVSPSEDVRLGPKVVRVHAATVHRLAIEAIAVALFAAALITVVYTVQVAFVMYRSTELASGAQIGASKADYDESVPALFTVPSDADDTFYGGAFVSNTPGSAPLVKEKSGSKRWVLTDFSATSSMVSSPALAAQASSGSFARGTMYAAVSYEACLDWLDTTHNVFSQVRKELVDSPVCLDGRLKLVQALWTARHEQVKVAVEAPYPTLDQWAAFLALPENSATTAGPRPGTATTNAAVSSKRSSIRSSFGLHIAATPLAGSAITPPASGTPPAPISTSAPDPAVEPSVGDLGSPDAGGSALVKTPGEQSPNDPLDKVKSSKSSKTASATVTPLDDGKVKLPADDDEDDAEKRREHGGQVAVGAAGDGFDGDALDGDAGANAASAAADAAPDFGSTGGGGTSSATEGMQISTVALTVVGTLQGAATYLSGFASVPTAYLDSIGSALSFFVLGFEFFQDIVSDPLAGPAVQVSLVVLLIVFAAAVLVNDDRRFYATVLRYRARRDAMVLADTAKTGDEDNEELARMNERLQAMLSAVDPEFDPTSATLPFTEVHAVHVLPGEERAAVKKFVRNADDGDTMQLPSREGQTTLLKQPNTAGFFARLLGNPYFGAAGDVRSCAAYHDKHGFLDVAMGGGGASDLTTDPLSPPSLGAIPEQQGSARFCPGGPLDPAQDKSSDVTPDRSPRGFRGLPPAMLPRPAVGGRGVGLELQPSFGAFQHSVASFSSQPSQRFEQVILRPGRSVSPPPQARSHAHLPQMLSPSLAKFAEPKLHGHRSTSVPSLPRRRSGSLTSVTLTPRRRRSSSSSHRASDASLRPGVSFAPEFSGEIDRSMSSAALNRARRSESAAFSSGVFVPARLCPVDVTPSSSGHHTRSSLFSSPSMGHLHPHSSDLSHVRRGSPSPGASPRSDSFISPRGPRQHSDPPVTGRNGQKGKAPADVPLETTGFRCVKHGTVLQAAEHNDVFPFYHRRKCCAVVNGEPCGVDTGVMYCCGSTGAPSKSKQKKKKYAAVDSGLSNDALGEHAGDREDKEDKEDTHAVDECRCGYALCEAHMRPRGPAALMMHLLLVASQFTGQGWAWFVEFLIISAASALYTPALRTCVMILGCHPVYQCEFGDCWADPTQRFAAAAYLSGVVILLFGLIFPLAYVYVLYARLNALRSLFARPSYLGRYLQHAAFEDTPLRNAALQKGSVALRLIALVPRWTALEAVRDAFEERWLAPLRAATEVDRQNEEADQEMAAQIAAAKAWDYVDSDDITDAEEDDEEDAAPSGNWQTAGGVEAAAVKHIWDAVDVGAEASAPECGSRAPPVASADLVPSVSSSSEESVASDAGAIIAAAERDMDDLTKALSGQLSLGSDIMDQLHFSVRTLTPTAAPRATALASSPDGSTAAPSPVAGSGPAPRASIDGVLEAAVNPPRPEMSPMEGILSHLSSSGMDDDAPAAGQAGQAETLRVLRQLANKSPSPAGNVRSPHAFSFMDRQHTALPTPGDGSVSSIDESGALDADTVSALTKEQSVVTDGAGVPAARPETTQPAVRPKGGKRRKTRRSTAHVAHLDAGALVPSDSTAMNDELPPLHPTRSVAKLPVKHARVSKVKQLTQKLDRVSQGEWQRFLLADKSVLAELYRNVPVERLAAVPVLTTVRFLLLVPPLLLEPSSASQFLLIAMGEMAFAAGFVLAEPFSSPWMTVTTLAGSVHQFLLVAFQATATARAHDVDLTGTSGTAMIVTTAGYVLFIALVVLGVFLYGMAAAKIEARKANGFFARFGLPRPETAPMYVCPDNDVGQRGVESYEVERVVLASAIPEPPLDLPAKADAAP